MVGKNSIAANSTTANVVTGQRYERAPFPYQIGQLFATGSAAGLSAELNVGGVSVTPPVVINTGNRVPVVPDDLVLENFEAGGGQLIQLTATNSTGGALDFYWKITLTEIQTQ